MMASLIDGKFWHEEGIWAPEQVVAWMELPDPPQFDSPRVITRVMDDGIKTKDGAA